MEWRKGILLAACLGVCAAADVPSGTQPCAPGVEPRTDSSFWNGWGVDPENSRHQPAAMAELSAADIPRLKLKWAFRLPGPTASASQPALVGGRLYLGSDSGTVYSLDAATGCVYWSFQADAPVRTAISLGANRHAKYALFFADTKAHVYSIDAKTGSLVWKTKVDDHPAARVTASPTLYGGRLYVPVSCEAGPAAPPPAGLPSLPSTTNPAKSTGRPPPPPLPPPPPPSTSTNASSTPPPPALPWPPAPSSPSTWTPAAKSGPRLSPPPPSPPPPSSANSPAASASSSPARTPASSKPSTPTPKAPPSGRPALLQPAPPAPPYGASPRTPKPSTCPVPPDSPPSASPTAPSLARCRRRPPSRPHPYPRRRLLRLPGWQTRAHSTRDGALLWSFDTLAQPGGGSIDIYSAIAAQGFLIVPSGSATPGGLPGNVLLAFTVDGR
ncbi:MAG: PQQ-binding-like beta-propeller repeat protein [Bryobacterales bacterium]|nr:PQQ-binding-like beta-propeller repeat protein [Bryobacterales bacterium]